MERLQDNRQVKKYVEQLQENDRMAEARECRYLMEQIDNLEWQLETVKSELKNLRRQLAKAERGVPQRSMKAAVQRAENVMKEVKGYIREIKRSVVSGMRKAVREVKKKGAAALDGAIDKLYIRVMLRNISMSMERSSDNMQETINRIIAASEESQKTKIHKRNISRVLFGKGREEVPETFELGAAARNAVRPFEIVDGICNEIQKQADRLEQRMARLSRRVELDKTVNVRQGGYARKQEVMQGDRVPRFYNTGQGKGQEQGGRNEQMAGTQTIRMLQEFRKSHGQSGRHGNMTKANKKRQCREIQV